MSKNSVAPQASLTIPVKFSSLLVSSIKKILEKKLKHEKGLRAWIGVLRFRFNFRSKNQRKRNKILSTTLLSCTPSSQTKPSKARRNLEVFEIAVELFMLKIS